MLAGAAIASAARRPWLAWPAGFLSHFVLDWAPHLDSHALFGVPSGIPTRPEMAMALADTMVGVFLVLWLVRGRPDRGLLIGGALFGILIDLADNVPPWGPYFRHWAGTAWLSAFHHGTQHNVTPEQWPLGFGTQAAVLGLATGALLCRSRRPRVRTEPPIGTARPRREPPLSPRP